jgi:translation initiation factor 3 subunit G
MRMFAVAKTMMLCVERRRKRSVSTRLALSRVSLSRCLQNHTRSRPQQNQHHIAIASPLVDFAAVVAAVVAAAVVAAVAAACLCSLVLCLQPSSRRQPITMVTRWGDDLDDSDEEPTEVVSKTNIPPTQYSRVDNKGVQIVTSYHVNESGQLIKTITKQKISKRIVKEPKGIQERRKWKKFGQALIDEKEGTETTVRSKDEVFLEDPHKDTDLQEDDPAKAIAGNLNEFWKKQQTRQLERKYDIQPEAAEENAAGGDWTQVGRPGKYVPPAARAGAPVKRQDDMNSIRVTNLSENTTENDLQELFSRFGRVARVYLAKDKETLQSRGFAFVSFHDREEAALAMEKLQGFGYDHLILKLEWARPNQNKEPTEFRSGYGKALAQDTKAKVSYASNLTK